MHPTANMTDFYWWQYVLTTYLLYPLIMLLSCLLSMFVVLGNLLVVTAIWHEHQLHSVTNYLIASLAAADCLVGAVVMPFSIISEIIIGSWTFGPVWCDLWHSFDVLASTASIMNLCAISLDRYLAITDPISYPNRMSPRRVAFLIVSVWTCSSLISFPAIIWWRAMKDGPLEEVNPPVNSNYSATISKIDNVQEPQYKCMFTDDPYYLLFSSFVSFYGPLCVMLYAYYCIYKAAVKQTRFLNHGSKRVIVNSKKRSRHASDRSVNSAHDINQSNDSHNDKVDTEGYRGQHLVLRAHRGGGGGASSSSIIRAARNNQSERVNNRNNEKLPRTSYSLTGRTSGAQNKTYLNSSPRDDKSQNSNSTTDFIIKSNTSSSKSEFTNSRGAQILVSIVSSRGKEDSASCQDSNNSTIIGSNLNPTSITIEAHSNPNESDSPSDEPPNDGTSKQEDDNKHSTNARILTFEGDRDQASGKGQLLYYNSEKLIQSIVDLRAIHYIDCDNQNAASKSSPQAENLEIKQKSNLLASDSGQDPDRLSKNNDVSFTKQTDVENHHKGAGKKLSKLAKERKAAKTLGIVVGVFILCWLPFFVVNIIVAICGTDCIYKINMVNSVVTWLGWLNSAMNPVIYACWSRDFRRAFRRVLCSWIDFICPYDSNYVTRKLKLKKNYAMHDAKTSRNISSFKTTTTVASPNAGLLSEANGNC